MRLSRTLFWILAVSCVLWSVEAEAQSFAKGPDFRVPHEREFVPGEVIVRYKADPDAALAQPDLEPQGMRRMQRASGGTVIYRIGEVEALLDPSTAPGADPAALRKQARKQTLAAVQELNRREAVDYAEPNYLLYPMVTPDDPLYSNQWHYFLSGSEAGEAPGGMDLPSMWNSQTGSRSIAVAVIDTGILPNHEDIVGSPNLAAGYDFITDSGRANDGDGRDDDPTDPGDAVDAGECRPGNLARDDSWHGTHVAGTVGVGHTGNGLGVAGVNWSVTVVPVRVLGKCGGTFVDIADAIRWAAGVSDPFLPPNPHPARVINMSLGGFADCGPTLQRAIDDAVNAGTTVVVSAGNEADDASRYAPASCTNVITTAAGDYRGHLARYSNFGTTVEIMAPGGDVERDDNHDDEPDGVLSMVKGTYAYYNGTSMAAPHVAGAAALLLADDPSLTPAQVLAELQARARPRDASHGCPAGRCGKGLLSLFRGPILSLSPESFELSKTFGSKEQTVTVSVREGGQLKLGAPVALSTGDASIATVTPSSGSTGTSGQFSATLRAESRGETTLLAESGNARESAPVKVPGLPFSLIAAGGITSLALRWARQRRLSQEPPA